MSADQSEAAAAAAAAADATDAAATDAAVAAAADAAVAAAAPSNTVSSSRTTRSPSVSALGKRARGSSPAVSDSSPVNNLIETLVLTVHDGGDVQDEILNCMEDGRGICILSAKGNITDAMLTPINARGEPQRHYTGNEILTMSGFFLPPADSPVGGINVLLAKSDGSAFGGTVVNGLLIAGSPVQVLLGIFDVVERIATRSPSTTVNNAGSSSAGAPSKSPTLKPDGDGAGASSPTSQGSGHQAV